jgi:hypothetical protein
MCGVKNVASVGFVAVSAPAHDETPTRQRRDIVFWKVNPDLSSFLLRYLELNQVISTRG